MSYEKDQKPPNDYHSSGKPNHTRPSVLTILGNERRVDTDSKGPPGFGRLYQNMLKIMDDRLKNSDGELDDRVKAAEKEIKPKE